MCPWGLVTQPDGCLQPNGPAPHRRSVKGSPFPQLIGLHGARGSGKATVAAHLCDAHDFRTYALADPIRAALGDLDPLLSAQVSLAGVLLSEHGWGGAMTHRIYGSEVTRLFTRYDETARAMFGSGVWVQQLLDRVLADGDLMGPAPVVVTDLTTVAEARWVIGQGGVVWFVERPGYTPDTHLPDNLIGVVIKNHATVLALTRRVDRAVGESHPIHLTAAPASTTRH